MAAIFVGGRGGGCTTIPPCSHRSPAIFAVMFQRTVLFTMNVMEHIAFVN